MTSKKEKNGKMISWKKEMLDKAQHFRIKPYENQEPG